MQDFAKKGIATALRSSLPKLNCSNYKKIVSPQVGRIMKLTAIILITACLHVAAKGVSQTVSLSEKNAPLTKVMKEIERQTGFAFFYKSQWLTQARRVTIKVEGVPLQQALDLCFKDQPFTYVISGKNIGIEPKEEEKQIDKPTVDISGKITDKEGNPLVGANVKIKGTNIGTTTNGDGSFSLNNVEENSTLEISYVGFETQYIGLHGRRALLINLNPKQSILDETIVIAYGTTTNRLSTGNISKVKASDIEKQPVNNPLLALQGRVPGVYITQTSGLPGAGVVVRIQGQNSLQNGNSPLYVIDGVPISTEIPSAGQGYTPFPNSGESYIKQGYTGKGSALTYLNPSDIESIEILKDADATAIYGSRAANGAILITTKKGKAGKTALNVDVQQGFGQVGHFMELLNTAEYIEMRNEALLNDGLTPSANTSANGQFVYAPDLMVWNTARQTNWQKELLGGTAQYTHANASISGGTQALQYLIGSNYHRETTVFPGTFSNKRGGMHFNLNNNDVNQKFHFQVSANYSIDNNKLPRTDLTDKALTLAPNAPELYNSDGSLNWAPDANGNSTFINPLARSVYRNYQSKTNNLIANANLSYDIFPGFKLSTNLGFTNLLSTDIQTNSIFAEKPEDRLLSSTQRYTFFGDSKLNTWIIEPQISYRKMVGKGKFDGLIGSTFQRTLKEAGYMAGVGFNNDQVMTSPNAATTLTSTGYFKNLYKYNAVFTRLNYSFYDKYILNLTGRRDGSTRFGANNKFHNFWSVGGGWIFSKEKIFLGNKSFFSFGKLKGNYGTSGNDQIGDYRFLTLYSVTNAQVPYQGNTGLAPGDIPNPYLQWEETRKLSIGIDLGFLNDKIFISANYSRNQSSNQLLSYLLPRITGRTSILTNFPATVQNSTWELSLNTENIKTKNISWTTSINFTIPRNKLVDFPNLENSSYNASYIVGEPISLFKLYPYVNVDPATGLYTVADSHGNPTVSPSVQTDRTVLFSDFPKFYGGFQNTLQYKGIQLDVLFQFVKKIAPTPTFGFWFSPGRFFSYESVGNQPTSVLNRWQKAGDNSSVQKFTASDNNVDNTLSNVANSDAYFTDASFVRIKNVSISWQIPSKWKERISLQSCRLFVQGQNLLTITNYQGLDPENPGYSNLPPLRVITFGVQVKL